MIKVYYKLVKEGRRSIDQVPANLRAAVENLLTNDRD
ncbi:CD1375 family protein [Fusibacter paucivorans]